MIPLMFILRAFYWASGKIINQQHANKDKIIE